MLRNIFLTFRSRRSEINEPLAATLSRDTLVDLFQADLTKKDRDFRAFFC